VISPGTIALHHPIRESRWCGKHGSDYRDALAETLTRDCMPRFARHATLGVLVHSSKDRKRAHSVSVAVLTFALDPSIKRQIETAKIALLGPVSSWHRRWSASATTSLEDECVNSFESSLVVHAAPTSSKESVSITATPRFTAERSAFGSR
jgi:hypothetical protein